jgi:hypothetical protein
MRERHFPRLCHTCQAPMARQESACWSCGSAWEAEPQLAGSAIGPGIGVEVGHSAPAHIPSDVDRWVSDGGRIGTEPVLAGT